MTRPDEAVALFQTGYSCTQAVLAVYGREKGVPLETAMKLATGFGGGMSRLGLTCGAVTGAIAALGLAHGQGAASEGEAKEETYACVAAFAGQFKERHGALSCRDLLGYDLSLPEERKAAMESGRVGAVCPMLVRSAAEILEGLL